MVPEASLDVSRRQFLAAAGLTIAAACLPRYLVAQADGLVQGAFKEAAKAKVTVQTLRRNVSVLLGAGGNIAVLVALTESCWLMPKSLPRVLTFLKPSRASTGIPSNN
jgi:hypothetical protein